MTRDPSAVVKRSLTIAGHRTSVSLEDAFWTRLGDLARREGISIAAMVARIDAGRGRVNLSSAIRVHVLEETAPRAEAQASDQLRSPGDVTNGSAGG